MNKTIESQYDLHPLIKNRYSPRIFSNKVISHDDLKTLLEAGRWSPSSNNIQPWRIVYGIKGDGIYKRILNCLDDFNTSWSDNATVLLLGGYYKKTPEGKNNFHALHDLGLFMGNLTVQAQSMDIAVHQMAGVNFEKAMKAFNFNSDDYHIATGIALGYYGGELEDLSDDLQKEERKKRTRKPLEAWAFNGTMTK
tara:strand:+ start:20635 stop:21219 length:585 start_codon:yes stop_codon:yes gene_type:complete